MQASRNSWHEDFDMAKLQKSLKQQQQRSRPMEHTVTKLTAAEVRSLNNSVALLRTANNPPSSYSPSKVLTNTPPLTPDNVLPTHRSSSNQNSISLPTPPQSPDDVLPQRQDSIPRNSMHILSPIPQAHGRVGFVLATNNSRPPSASSHRNIPTYRGPELTNNNSMSMLQPSLMTCHIVDNPLSQFSRPRQSRGSISPARQEYGQSTSRRTSDARSQRSHSLSMLDTTEERSISSLHRTESLVSACEAEIEREPSVPPAKPVKPVLQRTQSVTEEPRTSTESRSRFGWGWRKHSTTHRNDSDDGTEIKKTRRRTISWSRGSKDAVRSVTYENIKSDASPEKKVALNGELPSSIAQIHSTGQDETKIDESDVKPHPVIQLSGSHSEDQPGSTENANPDEEEVDSSHDVLADDSIPMYSRCACCGKLKKPHGNRSLSPVLENENSRSNMSADIQRNENISSDQRRSSSGNQPKDTSIISTAAGDGSIVQVSTEPPLESSEELYDLTPTINERGDIIAAGNKPITFAPKPFEDNERRLVRFSSLYFKDGAQQRANIAKRTRDDDVNRRQTDMRRRAQTSPDEYSSISNFQTFIQQQQLCNQKNSTTDILKDKAAALRTSPPGITHVVDGVGDNVDMSAVKALERNSRRHSDQSDHAKMYSSQQQVSTDLDVVSSASNMMVQETTLQRPHTIVSNNPSGAPLDLQVIDTSNISSDRVLDSAAQLHQANFSSAMATQDDSVITHIEYPSRAPSIKPKSPLRKALHAKDVDPKKDPVRGFPFEDISRSGTIMLGSTVHSDTTESSSERNTSIHDEGRSANTEPEHKSPRFDLLPLPQFGNHFEESIAFLNYGLSSGNGSNLVQSVLAATNANHYSNDDDMGRF